jgi:hypothetical protein
MGQILKSCISAAAVALAAATPPAVAMNRCITPEGRTVYTDDRCEAVGAKPHGQVRGSISVVPGQTPEAPRAAPAPKPEAPRAEPARPFERNERAAVFRKSPNAPVLKVCYDSKDARADTSVRDMEAAVRDGLAQWNAGCNINYEYLGVCPADAGLWQRNQADYKVYWETWDNSLTISDKPDRPERLAREHAIAMANPVIGVSLNRDMSVPAWRWQRAIAHEFGHVVGIGHSRDPGDLMFSGGTQRTPTAADYAMCNYAIQVRHGIKAEFR